MPETPNPTHDVLRAIVEQLRSVAGDRAPAEVIAALEAADSRLGETVFRLVVLGEYKRGKSTLINALLGTSVLPMAVVPLTSVVTEVRYAAHPSTRIDFLDGRSRVIGPDELRSYVTEPENPRNHKGVRRAVVLDSAPLLHEGVIIVDTPGIGSVFEHNSEVTYEFLEESDAVVIVLAADQPISAEERRLLAALAGITDRILFVVNRVDVLSPTEVTESVQFIRQTLGSFDARPPRTVYALSARRALEARSTGPMPADFVAFEAALRRGLIEQKSAVLQDRAQTLMRKAADMLSLQLDTERHALQMNRQDLVRAAEQLAQATGQVQRHLVESEHLLKFEVEELHRVELKRYAEETAAHIKAKLWPKIEESLDAPGAESISQRVARLAVSIGEWVVEELGRYYRGTEPLMQHGLERALNWHMQRVHAATGEVISLVNGLLGMSARIPEALAPLRPKPRFYFKDWDYAGGSLRGSTWKLRLPKRWAEPQARELLRELLERRISQNQEAIRYDWVTRLDDAVRQFHRSSREQLAAITTIITEALHRAQALRANSDVAAEVTRLDREVQQIARLRERLPPSARTESPGQDGVGSVSGHHDAG